MTTERIKKRIKSKWELNDWNKIQLNGEAKGKEANGKKVINNNNENSLVNDTHKNVPLPFFLISLRKFVPCWSFGFSFRYLLLQSLDVNLRRKTRGKFIAFWMLDGSMDCVWLDWKICVSMFMWLFRLSFMAHFIFSLICCFCRCCWCCLYFGAKWHHKLMISKWKR